MAISVDPGRDQHTDPDHASTFADIEYQRVGGDDCERPGLVEPAGAGGLDVLVEAAAITDTYDFDSPVMPRDCTSGPYAGWTSRAGSSSRPHWSGPAQHAGGARGGKRRSGQAGDAHTSSVSHVGHFKMSV